MIGLDSNDPLVTAFLKSQGGTFVDKEDLKKIDVSVPVVMRSMTKRKVIKDCWEEGRDFYYIDNGYIGNAMKKKWYYRVVKNDVQHQHWRKNLPESRFEKMQKLHPWLRYKGRKTSPDNGPILLVTPSEKPCKFYGVERNIWVNETINEIKKYTDRRIIVRDKGLRGDRVGDNSVAAQCLRDGVHALVTYQSIAALEAIHYGIPAYTLAPTALGNLANNDLSTIETPMYPDEGDFRHFLNYLAFCQYTPGEIESGVAYNLIKEYDLW
jgi:hypothetical protein